MQGFYNVRRENDADKEALNLATDILKSVLKEVGVRGSARLGVSRVLTQALVWPQV